MNIVEKLKIGLAKTREGFFKKIVSKLRGRKIDPETIEEIEELLITADVGTETTMEIMERLENTTENPLNTIREVMLEILEGDTKLVEVDSPPLVISVVGVNGSGKTTTCAKLAKFYKDMGKSVVMAAADTFRAAAIDQLKIWGKRVRVDVIAHSEGADPGAVAFDAVNHAKARGKDVVIIDTAGRLHTKIPLMEELKKIHRVVGKIVEGAPHEVLLVIDATNGQNALVQARVFKESVGVTGLVITKLDGTAKGGVVLAIAKELGIPIKFVGVGEGEDDLKPFDPKLFVDVLLGVV